MVGLRLGVVGLRVVASVSAALLALAEMTNLLGEEPRRQAPEPSAMPAAFKTPRLDQFDKYYAMSVKPDAAALPHKADAYTIVVVFNTSASQNGEFRTRGLATLRAFLGKLNATDRVCLLAADTSVAPMTTNEAGKTATFVAPEGKEIDAALAKLHRRVPLGATDMPLMLHASAEALRGSKGPRALVYIGDGRNTGGSVDPSELKEAVELLVGERIPVSSYAIGSRVDAGLLARLANHTGGVVGFDNPQIKTDDRAAGEALAAAATEVVVWPGKLQLPEGLSEVYPKRMPPLRADRDTILVGQGKAVGPFQVSLTGTVNGATQELTWKITPSAPTDDNAYLAKIVEGAQRDDGESLATVGSAGLMEVRRLTMFQAEGLRQLAGQVLRVDPRLAQRLGRRAQQIDPDLPGQRLEFVAQKAVEAGKAPGEGIVVEMPAVKEQADEPGGLLGKAVQEKKIIGERLQTEVRNQIDAANRLMATNPQGALESLKVLQQAVRGEPIIDPELRDSLLKQIDGAMARVHTVESSASSRRLQVAADDAIRAENRRLRSELVDKEKRISQWMAKFDSLMDEKKFTQAESIADLAMAMAPGNSEIANAGLNATMRRAIDDGIYLRRQRIRGVLLTLREVEYSDIPSPDEPPVVFPPKEWWDAMTKRRAEYKAVSLSSQSDAEKRIMSELQKPTQVEFNETSLKDAVNYLKELHGINIEISQKKLEEANVQLDTPITKVLRGVTLKSALKLILHDLGLAYIVRDEVLLITSKEEADTYLVTKVYPVGDLVVPIVPAQQFGGGQQGGFGQGGGGGFGGGGQQGGGGQFGGGGGGGQFGGGGGQGGGGGFFSVPSSPFRAYNAAGARGLPPALVRWSR